MDKITEDPFLLLQQNRVEDLKLLLQENPRLAESINKNEVSLLLTAIYHRNHIAIGLIRPLINEVTIWEAACLGEIIRVQEQLLDHPLLLNASSPDGFTLLGYACFFGQVATASFLIARGADINLPSKNNFKVAPLHSACAISNIELVTRLIDGGADVNAKQQGGFTPLHSAVQNKSGEIIRILLQAGADPDAENEKGVTPAMLAQQSGYEFP